MKGDLICRCRLFICSICTIVIADYTAAMNQCFPKKYYDDPYSIDKAMTILTSNFNVFMTIIEDTRRHKYKRYATNIIFLKEIVINKFLAERDKFRPNQEEDIESINQMISRISNATYVLIDKYYIRNLLFGKNREISKKDLLEQLFNVAKELHLLPGWEAELGMTQLLIKRALKKTNENLLSMTALETLPIPPSKWFVKSCPDDGALILREYENARKNMHETKSEKSKLIFAGCFANLVSRLSKILPEATKIWMELQSDTIQCFLSDYISLLTADDAESEEEKATEIIEKTPIRTSITTEDEEVIVITESNVFSFISSLFLKCRIW